MAYKISSVGSSAQGFEMRDQFRAAAVFAKNIADGMDDESTVEIARFLGMTHRSPKSSSAS